MMIIKRLCHVLLKDVLICKNTKGPVSCREQELWQAAVTVFLIGGRHNEYNFAIKDLSSNFYVALLTYKCDSYFTICKKFNINFRSL